VSIVSGVPRARQETTRPDPPDPPNRHDLPGAVGPVPTAMPPVPSGQFDSTEVRQARRRERVERRALYRSRWWFPLLIVGMVLGGFWGALKVDQRVAEELVWPSHGARFAEVSSSIDTIPRPGGRLMIVVGGLNRTSGTGVALALLPSLEADGTRVFSLVYGSGINDQDIRDKFDALVAEVKPREVSFFGSSMGGDVVLNMAAHAQEDRDRYVQDTVLGTVGIGGIVGTDGLTVPDAGPARDAGPAVGDGSAAAATTPTDPDGGQPLGSETAGLTDFLVPAALTNTLNGLVGRLPVAAADAGGPAAGTSSDNIGRHDNGNGSSGRTSTSAANGLAAGGTLVSGSQSVSLPPPRIGTIYLDCTPLGTDDVRDASRTQADAFTGLTEAIGTDGGAVTRLAAEMLGQRHQWASGRFPFLQVRWDDFDYKVDQVMREKIGGTGVSTQLIKDQYGVIRRLDMSAIAGTLASGTRIVYFLPTTPTDDRTVRVEQVQTELQELETSAGLNVRFEQVPGGHHASAESNPDSYRLGIDTADDNGP